jgi:hypothetical protein
MAALYFFAGVGALAGVEAIILLTVARAFGPIVAGKR